MPPFLFLFSFVTYIYFIIGWRRETSELFKQFMFATHQHMSCVDAIVDCIHAMLYTTHIPCLVAHTNAVATAD